MNKNLKMETSREIQVLLTRINGISGSFGTSIKIDRLVVSNSVGNVALSMVHIRQKKNELSTMMFVCFSLSVN